MLGNLASGKSPPSVPLRLRAGDLPDPIAMRARSLRPTTALPGAPPGAPARGPGELATEQERHEVVLHECAHRLRLILLVQLLPGFGLRSGQLVEGANVFRRESGIE